MSYAVPALPLLGQELSVLPFLIGAQGHEGPYLTIDPSGHRDALAVQDPSAESGRNTLPRGKDADEVDRVRGADDDRGFGTRLAVAAQGGDGLGVGELLAAEAGDEQAGTLRRRQLGWDAGDGQGVPASGPVDGVEGNRTLLRGRRVVTLLATNSPRAAATSVRNRPLSPTRSAKKRAPRAWRRPSSRRSHHCSPGRSGSKRPRTTKPSCSSAAGVFSRSLRGKASGGGRGPWPGPVPDTPGDCGRVRTGHFPDPRGQDLQGNTGNDGRIHGDNGGQLWQPLGGTQDDRSSWYLQTHRAPLRSEVGKELRAGAQLVPGQKSGQQ